MGRPLRDACRDGDLAHCCAGVLCDVNKNEGVRCEEAPTALGLGWAVVGVRNERVLGGDLGEASVMPAPIAISRPVACGLRAI